LQKNTKNSIYEQINKTIYSPSILEFAKELFIFVDMALEEKNKEYIVKMFYEKFLEWSMSDYVMEELFEKDSRRIYICDGYNAVAKFIKLTMPSYETPVKSLKKLRKYSEKLLSEYSEPAGEKIQTDNLKKIMAYLDNKYDFSNVIFSDQKAIFAVLDITSKKYNSECIVTISDKGIGQHFLLYCLKTDCEGITPEAVLFHELGHAIHARYSGSLEKVPEKIINLLKELCMPALDEASNEIQSEVLADVLSVGMMHDSPFEEYDYFSYIHLEVKDVFSALVEKMMDTCRNQKG